MRCVADAESDAALAQDGSRGRGRSGPTLPLSIDRQERTGFGRLTITPAQLASRAWATWPAGQPNSGPQRTARIASSSGTPAHSARPTRTFHVAGRQEHITHIAISRCSASICARTLTRARASARGRMLMISPTGRQPVAPRRGGSVQRPRADRHCPGATGQSAPAIGDSAAASFSCRWPARNRQQRFDPDSERERESERLRAAGPRVISIQAHG